MNSLILGLAYYYYYFVCEPILNQGLAFPKQDTMEQGWLQHIFDK
jgi:hypothetical protein